MDFINTVKTRRSIRAYKPDPIPDAILERVLDCARLAPSANNTQPWRFIVVRDDVKRRELVKASGHAFMAQAPVLIVCCGKRYEDPYSWIGAHMYLVDCAIAIDHLTLAARNEGLGTCWIGAFDHEAIKKIANVQAGYDVIALVPVGYPAMPAAFHESKTRYPLKTIVTGL